MTTFTRESRYFVLKSADAKAALTQTDQEILDILCDKVARWRSSHGKANLSGVFVEHDWPEHDGVWAAIEQRVSGEPAPAMQAGWPQPYPKKEPLVWPDLECVHDWVKTEESAYSTCIYCKKSEALDANRR